MYKDRVFGLKIFNPVSDKDAPGGLHQYAYPATEELTGRHADFFFDGYGEISLQWTDARNVLLRGENKQSTYPYTAVKADDDTYLVLISIGETAQAPHTLLSLVFDRVEPMATLVVSTLGKDQSMPKLVHSTPYFGTKTINGHPLTDQRQGYTDALVGTRIEWFYTPNDAVLHIFPSTTRQRLGRNNYHLAPDATRADRDNYLRRIEDAKRYPFYEELAFYVRLKDNLYLYSVIEYNGYRLNPSAYGSELMVLLDAKRVRYIGRTYGMTPEDASRFDIVGAPGRFSDTADEIESIPCPYYRFDDDPQDII